MKMKPLAYTISICILFFWALLPGLQVALAGSQGPPHTHRQHQIGTQEGIASVRGSKGTVLILLTVGIIGVLSVRRKKKAPKCLAQPTAPQTTHKDRNSVFIDLNKQYLNLQYKIVQHKFSGDAPPDGLLKEISDIERKVRLISRALE